MPIIDHFSIYCPETQYEAVTAFYTKILHPLGIVKVLDQPNFIGFGKGPGGEPGFEIFREAPDDHGSSPPRLGIHFAFVADTRSAVRDFYEAALQAGAKPNGKPGLRPQYTPTYYAAFVIDPIGNGIEAVCQTEEEEEEGTR
jgi:catechol-2,3-dioxygenase